MAVNLSIKNVSDDLAERLRARAERNHRSLQGELMAIVSAAAAEPAAASAAAPAPERARRGGIGEGVRYGWMTTEQVIAERDRLWPGKVFSGPLGVDIIRADRDSR